MVLKTRADENDDWTVMDVSDYDPSVAGYYMAEVTLGYDHDNYAMYSGAEWDEQSQKWVYNYSDVYTCEWQISSQP